MGQSSSKSTSKQRRRDPFPSRQHLSSPAIVTDNGASDKNHHGGHNRDHGHYTHRSGNNDTHHMVQQSIQHDAFHNVHHAAAHSAAVHHHG